MDYMRCFECNILRYRLDYGIKKEKEYCLCVKSKTDLQTFYPMQYKESMPVLLWD